jgi:hypothetical protein
MPEEKLVQSRPLRKTLVKLFELQGEGFTHILIVTGHRRLSRIGEDCHSSLTQLDEVRLSA